MAAEVLPTLDEGPYCYKVMAPGWVSMIGLVVIDASAPAANELIIDLPLAA